MIIVALALLVSASDFAAAAEQGVPVQPEWSSSGQNNHNTRYAAGEHTINADNVGSLKPMQSDIVALETYFSAAGAPRTFSTRAG